MSFQIKGYEFVICVQFGDEGIRCYRDDMGRVKFKDDMSGDDLSMEEVLQVVVECDEAFPRFEDPIVIMEEFLGADRSEMKETLMNP
jgi:hypothetical protein